VRCGERDLALAAALYVFTYYDSNIKGSITYLSYTNVPKVSKPGNFMSISPQIPAPPVTSRVCPETYEARGDARL